MMVRDVAARAIYARHPFYLGETREVFPHSHVAERFDWDGAPAYYQEQCYELADAVLAAIGVEPGSKYHLETMP